MFLSVNKLVYWGVDCIVCTVYSHRYTIYLGVQCTVYTDSVQFIRTFIVSPFDRIHSKLL